MSVAVGTTAAQTPLQPNFGGLKGQVAGYVQGKSLPAVLTDAGAAINSAINKINTKTWHWLNRQETLTLVTDQRTYTIAANFKKPYSLFRLDSNSKQQGRLVFQIPALFFATEWSDAISGAPEHYTVRNAPDDRLLTLSVPPSSTFVASFPTLQLSYYARLARFSDDGDTIGDLKAPPEVAEFLDWYAKWKVASTRGSASQIRTANTAWKEIWRDLRTDDFDEQSDYGSYR